MRSISVPRPSPALIVALIALFVGMSSTGYAAVRLAANSVTSAKIKNGQVKTADLANDAVTAAKLAPKSVETESLVSEAVTTAKLDQGAAAHDRLADGAGSRPRSAGTVSAAPTTLLRRPLSRAHRAVHVPAPLGGRLGARPVDPAHGLAQSGAVVEQHARRRPRAVATAAPLLLHPVLLHVLARGARGGPEPLGELGDHRRAPLGERARAPFPGLLALDEAEQHSGGARRRGVVVGRPSPGRCRWWPGRCGPSARQNGRS